MSSRRISPSLGAGLAALLSGGALATALLSEYWGGLAPCILCHYQRYAHAAVLAVALVVLLALRNRPLAARRTTRVAGVLFLLGAAIAGFHVGVEQGWWQGTPGCHAPSLDPDLSTEELREQMLATRFAPCDTVTWAFLGISMAGYNFLVSLAAGLFLLLWPIGISKDAEA